MLRNANRFLLVTLSRQRIRAGSSRSTGKRFHWSALGALVAMLFFVLPAQAQRDFMLPPIGGDGGGNFINRCPQGQLLTGFDLHTGDDVDAIRPICVTAYGPTDVGPRVAGGIWSGGNGGGPRQLLCPGNAPIVTGMYVDGLGVDTIIVNKIHLFCGIASTTQTPHDVPDVSFDGSGGRTTVNLSGGRYSGEVKDTQRCLLGRVAVGINGRSGVWLDAVGLICAEPKLTARPDNRPVVKGVGRTQTGAPTGPPESICDRAREARARNSPAAPGLEEQCRAFRARQVIAAGKEKDTITIGGANQRQPRVNDPRSTLTGFDFITVQIKSRKEYGYRHSTNAGPTSCDAFSVSAYQTSPGRPRSQFRMSDTDFKMTEANGYYVCNYVFAGLPLNQDIRVLATVSDAVAPWEGGSQAQPPAGQQRTIPNNGNILVTLTEAQPRPTFIFEMIYAPPPSR